MSEEKCVDLKVNLRNILKVYITTYVLSALIDYMLKNLSPGTRSYLDTSFLHLLMLALTYLMIFKKAEVGLREIADFKSIHFKDIGILLGYSLVLAGINASILRGIGIIGFFVSKLSVLFNLKLAMLTMTFNFMLVAVAEEYFERAVLFNYFNVTLKKPKVFSVISTSVIFALLHFVTGQNISLFSFSSHFVLGVVLCLLYIKNYNLVPSIIVHFFYNWMLSLIGLVLAFAR